MKTIIDANYILRWFLYDVPAQAKIVDVLLQASEPESLLLDRITIAEITYVLRGKGYDHKQIALLLEELLYYPSLVPLALAETVALKVYRHTLLDFEDCLLLAVARTKGYQLATFDKALLKASKE